MENASKALIIAGAILLSILIISLGIVVVNNTRTTIDKANVNQQEVSTFNSQFEAYVGKNRTMSDVRAVAALVFSNNGAQNQNKTNNTVKFNYTNAQGTAENDKKTIPTDLQNGKTYEINVAYGNDGYITDVNVK